MKCPYCNEELESLGFAFGDMPLKYRCKNPDCAKKYDGASMKVWKDLTKTKQALDVARNGLEYIFGYEDVPKYVVKHITQVLDQIKQITETKDTL